MAPISLDQLFMIIERQDERISSLQNEIEKLKNWSDLNDHYLQEMIDSTGRSVDRLMIAINELHEVDIPERIKELEEEDQMPVAQLLLEFIENNATDEQKQELDYESCVNKYKKTAETE